MASRRITRETFEAVVQDKVKRYRMERSDAAGDSMHRFKAHSRPLPWPRYNDDGRFPQANSQHEDWSEDPREDYPMEDYPGENFPGPSYRASSPLLHQENYFHGQFPREQREFGRDYGRPAPQNREFGRGAAPSREYGHHPAPQSREYGQQNREYGQQNREYGQQNREYGQQNREYGQQNREYGQQNREYGQQSREYGQQNREYGQQNREYGQQSREYGQQSREYGQQSREYGQQSREYGQQSREYGQQSREYGQQSREYGQQNREYGQQNREYGQQNREYGQQSREYGQQNREYGRDRDYGHGGQDYGPSDCWEGAQEPEFGSSDVLGDFRSPGLMEEEFGSVENQEYEEELGAPLHRGGVGRGRVLRGKRLSRGVVKPKGFKGDIKSPLKKWNVKKAQPGLEAKALEQPLEVSNQRPLQQHPKLPPSHPLAAQGPILRLPKPAHVFRNLSFDLVDKSDIFSSFGIEIIKWAGFHAIKNDAEFSRLFGALFELETETCAKMLASFKCSLRPEHRDYCFFTIKSLQHAALKTPKVDNEFLNMLLDKGAVKTKNCFFEIIKPFDKYIMRLQDRLLKGVTPLLMACNAYELSIKTNGFGNPREMANAFETTVSLCRKSLALLGQTFALASVFRQEKILEAVGLQEMAPAPTSFPNFDDSTLFGREYIENLKAWLEKSGYPIQMKKAEAEPTEQPKTASPDTKAPQRADRKVLDTIEQLVSSVVSGTLSARDRSAQKNCPEYWFLSDEESLEYKYYRLRLAEVQRRSLGEEGAAPEALRALLYARRVASLKRRLFKKKKKPGLVSLRAPRGRRGRRAARGTQTVLAALKLCHGSLPGHSLARPGTALGATSAPGGGTWASGGGTSAPGGDTTTLGGGTWAPGGVTTAPGGVTTAPGGASSALGDATSASGDATSALGDATTASGGVTSALGGATSATGGASSALGGVTTAFGGVTSAPGGDSSAFGGATSDPGGVTTTPGSATTAPGSATSAPGSATTAPGGATTAPGSATTAPGSATSAPGSATTAPGGATSAPGSATTAPGSATSAPGSATTAPGGATSAPGSATTAPGSATTAPGGATSAPGSATSAPGGATSAPGSATTAPGGATSAPGGATSAPGGATTAPGGATTAPGGATSAPGSATTAPGSATSAPGSATSAPGGATTAPGSATTAPGSATSAPGGATTAPGSATTAPGGATSAPGGATSSEVPEAAAGGADPQGPSAPPELLLALGSQFPEVDAKTMETAEKLARFVAQVGPEIEQFSIDNSADNPDLWFLQDPSSPAFQFYRLKVFELCPSISFSAGAEPGLPSQRSPEPSEDDDSDDDDEEDEEDLDGCQAAEEEDEEAAGRRVAPLEEGALPRAAEEVPAGDTALRGAADGAVPRLSAQAPSPAPGAPFPRKRVSSKSLRVGMIPASKRICLIEEPKVHEPVRIAYDRPRGCPVSKKKKRGRAVELAQKRLSPRNVGFQMLQRMGWQEGHGLGTRGRGIREPVHLGATSAGEGLGVAGEENQEDAFDIFRQRMIQMYRQKRANK